MAENENAVEAAQLLGDDGAFQDGWQGLAFPDDTDPHKTNQTLANIKDIRSMARQVVSGESTIGKLSGGREFAILPNEQSTDEEKNEFHTKCGRPDTKEGYKLNDLTLPDGLPKDEKLAGHMADVLHKAGASTAIATAVHNGYAEYIKSSMEAAATQDKIDDAEANKNLRGKWGAAYDKNMAFAVSAANAFGGVIDAAETAELIKELPHDSFAAQMLAKAGEVIAEKPMGQKPADTTGELTPGDAMSKFNELAKDPYYMSASPKDKPMNQQYHDELVQKGVKLIELAKNKGGA